MTLLFPNRFFEAKVKRTETCWLWMGNKDKHGYGQSGKRNELAHRRGWKLLFGPIPDGLWVLHRCDNPPCVNPKHLFLGTAGDNARDRARKGRNGDQWGERNPSAKLTQEQVDAIRLLYASDRAIQRIIANQFSVSQTLISAIVRGKIWTRRDSNARDKRTARRAAR